jgi:hypothetical protein
MLKFKIKDLPFQTLLNYKTHMIPMQWELAKIPDGKTNSGNPDYLKLNQFRLIIMAMKNP